MHMFITIIVYFVVLVIYLNVGYAIGLFYWRVYQKEKDQSVNGKTITVPLWLSFLLWPLDHPNVMFQSTAAQRSHSQSIIIHELDANEAKYKLILSIFWLPIICLDFVLVILILCVSGIIKAILFIYPFLTWPARLITGKLCYSRR